MFNISKAFLDGSFDAENFRYCFDRGDSKATSAQGRLQSAEDQANARAALAKTNSALSDYDSNLKNFMKFGRQTYGENGDYMRDQNTLANTTAAAGTTSLKGNLALNAMRTGENTSGYADTAAESQRSSSRDLTTQLAGADSDRLSKLTAIEAEGLDESKFPATVQAGLYGSALGGTTGNLSASASAAQTPGFWDVFAPALASGAGAAAAGICPCEGSMIRMSDGTEKPVEQLRAGDYVWTGMMSPPNQILTTPTPIQAESWVIETEAGRKHKGSTTHTLGLATGGYGYMPELRGKVVIGDLGSDMVKEALPIGKATVYPLQVGGCHSYFADGLYCLA